VSDGPLYRVSASGGLPTAVTRLDPSRGESSHRWPFFLPDGKHFLYLVASFGGKSEGMGVYVRSLDPKEERFLVPAKSRITYVSPGFLLFLREGNLLAQPLDPTSFRLTGEPSLVAEQLQWFPQTYNTLFSASDTGVLLYQARSAAGVSQLVWFDRSGKEVGSLGAPADQANPRISPDGKRVAVDIIDLQTGNSDVFAYEASGGIPTRLTSDPGFDNQPIWSPDGSRIAFMSLRRGYPDLYVKSSSGGGGELGIQSQGNKYPTDWSPDGKVILYRSLDPGSNLELWVLPIDGNRKPIPFIRSAFGVSHGQFSPDGRWVAYTSNESGKWEIYVAPFPGPGGNWKISTAGGSEPRWRGDGKELFYVSPDGKLIAVEVKAVGSAFEAGATMPLFQTRRREHISAGDLFSYDVSSDGQRFLVNTDVGETTASPLTVVVNWTKDLKR
jgi:Tol biopolymer transport system component